MMCIISEPVKPSKSRAKSICTHRNAAWPWPGPILAVTGMTPPSLWPNVRQHDCPGTPGLALILV